MILPASIPQLVAFATNLFLLFVVLRSSQRPIYLVYGLFSTCVLIWTMCAFILFYDLSTTNALFWGRVLHIAVLFIPVLFFNFIYLLLEFKKNKIIIFFLYGIAFYFFILNISGNLIVAVKKSFFGYYSLGGSVYPFFSLYVVSTIVVSLILILKEMFKANSGKLRQLKLIACGTALALLGGINDLLPVVGFNYYPFTAIPVYRLGSLMIGVYGVCVAYAIIRHQFLDIEVIVRRTLIFAGLLGFVFAVFTAATFFIKDIVSLHYKLSSQWANVISLVVIVFSYDYIRNFLINLTDKFLFQKGYNYQKLLKDASRGMSNIESLEHLLSLVIHFITMKMRVRNAAVLSRMVDSTDFRMEYQRGYEKNFLEFHLEENSPLIQYLRQEKEAVDLERINEYLDAGSKKKSRSGGYQIYDFTSIREEMQRMQSVCCVPSFLGEELRNILLLGEKKSGHPFTDEDLSVLYTLAQESSIAIENARLFDEAVKKSAELEKINEQLAFSRDLLCKALAETEVANKQLQDTQAQLIHEQKMATLGRLAASVGHEVNNPLTILSMNVSRALLKYRKNPDLRVSEILDLFEKMEQNINRIKAVVNTLTGLLKKSEKGKFEPLSLKLILEETLPLVQFQTYLDNLTGTEVEFDVPSSLPLVRGDLERLQEVFLNLFINAYHAMAEKRDRKIKVWAEVAPESPGMVSIYFQDNGSGMKPETMAKIFNYGFTTKPPGRGSGLGLYMCKYIIELHGGDVKVTSEMGVGTTFILTLPAFSEVTTIAGDESGFNRKASGE